MVQFKIISGTKAGTQVAARRFPFCVGRSSGNGLQLNDDGVWDSHLVIELKKREGFKIVTVGDALATINNEPVQSSWLRNGDIVTLGSAKIQFWLAPPRQRGLRAREFFVWTLIALISFAQVALVYWLVQKD